MLPSRVCHTSVTMWRCRDDDDGGDDSDAEPGRTKEGEPTQESTHAPAYFSKDAGRCSTTVARSQSDGPFRWCVKTAGGGPRARWFRRCRSSPACFRGDILKHRGVEPTWCCRVAPAIKVSTHTMSALLSFHCGSGGVGTTATPHNNALESGFPAALEHPPHVPEATQLVVDQSTPVDAVGAVVG